jgi:hypothetical protein
MGLEFGGYRIVSVLGEGGMGAVFLAEHRQLARKAAIKILLPGLSSVPDAVARFFAEARAASLIKHPGIVEVFECGELDDDLGRIVDDVLPDASGCEREARRANQARDLAIAGYATGAVLGATALVLLWPSSASSARACAPAAPRLGFTCALRF